MDSDEEEVSEFDEVEDPIFYEHLERFPGVLFDRHGYVVFANEASYRNCRQLQHGIKLTYRGGRDQQENPLPAFRRKGRSCRRLSERPVPAPARGIFQAPAQLILANLKWIARSLATAEDIRGCAFLNAIAELGDENSKARDLAVGHKESRRLWYRDLLSKLGVDDPDRLTTQLSLLVDRADPAALIRKDPQAMQSAIAAARTLLKAAGVQLSADGPMEAKAH